MTKWEYLILRIVGHNKELSDAQNMVVYTSDGRFDGRVRQPKDVHGLINSLGADGWEMMSSSGAAGQIGLVGVAPAWNVEAVFKRQAAAS